MVGIGILRRISKKLDFDGTSSTIGVTFTGSSQTGQVYNNILEQASGSSGGWMKVQVGGVTRYLQLYTGTATG